ncbi:MAG TPA: transcriptional regulator [Planctomycetes bacterium]|nr:transcriptional regulator [Planctomycetota bacterium]
MQVPLLDLKAQLAAIEQDIKKAVLEVIDSGRYIMGPQAAELERQVAAYVGTRRAVGVSSGTDALLASLMALGVGRGDIVLTTPYSFFATAGVIARLGAEPAFVDIDRATYNLDPARLEAWFESAGGRAAKVKAILPVHLYGQCAAMDPIMAIARRRGAPVVEDCCQAIGAAYPSQAGLVKAGAIGRCGCFSFFPSKNLGGMGDGGMVTTDDEALAETLARLRNHGMHPKYYHALVGGNFRLDTLQAAVLLAKMPHLESWHAARRAHAAYYDERFRGSAVAPPACAYDRAHHVYNQYVIAVPERRDELREFLAGRGIGTEVYYPLPIHLQECFRSLGCRPGDFPESERAAAHTLALPVYPELTDAMQAAVAGAILEFYG